MAEPEYPCNCTPYKNLYCRGPVSGITIVQPECQKLPDGRVVNNPAYNPSTATSYWTYKSMVDCSVYFGGIKSIAIPVCQYINRENISVFEKIDGCGDFVSTPFALSKSSPSFGIAPAGYFWLIIENGDRYCIGVSVVYLLEIVGDYPAEAMPVKVKTPSRVLTFECGGVLVPKCSPQGRLFVRKNCKSIIVDNKAALSYKVDITNTGSTFLYNVMYHDVVYIPPQLVLGTIKVNPSSLTVDTSEPGKVIISGNIGLINKGQTTKVTYHIPVASIARPQRYMVSNTAQAFTNGTESTAFCTTFIDAVGLDAAKYCSVTEGGKCKFTIIISSVDYSPDTIVDIEDSMFIPAGVTLRFNDLGGCTAEFSEGGEVPIERDITGPKVILIKCKNLRILKDGCAKKVLTFTAVSSSFPGSSTISNSLTRVDLSNPVSQILLYTGPLPAKADIDVMLNITCSQPCNLLGDGS